MPKIKSENIETYDRQVYPGQTRARTDGYSRLRLSDAGALSQFGVGLVTLQPGGATSLLHWHEREDELIYVLEGELTVIEGDETYALRPGETATFKAGVPVGHTVENRGQVAARFIEIGTRDPDEVAHYPELDMIFRRNAQPTPYFTRGGDPIAANETPKTMTIGGMAASGDK